MVFGCYCWELCFLFFFQILLYKYVYISIYILINLSICQYFYLSSEEVTDVLEGLYEIRNNKNEQAVDNAVSNTMQKVKGTIKKLVDKGEHSSTKTFTKYINLK